MKKLRTFFVCIFMAVHAFSSVFASSGELSGGLPNGSGTLAEETGSWADISTGGLMFPDPASTGELLSPEGIFTETTSSMGVLESSGAASDSGLTDIIPPVATKLAYFDDNHNGRVDRIEITNSEAMTGRIDISKIEIYSAANGLGTSKINTLPGYVTSFHIKDSVISLNIQEQDMIRPSLHWTTDTSSDLRVYIPNSAGFTDLAGNTYDPWLKITHDYSQYDGVENNMGAIKTLDTGILLGKYFSGALSIGKVDSRWTWGPLILSGIILTVSDDSFLGDGNILEMGTDSGLQGNTTLTLGKDSKILGDAGETLFSKNSFRSAFSDTANSTYYDYNGTITGSGIDLMVDYIVSGTTLYVYSWALGNHIFMPIPLGMTGWEFRATVSKKFLPGSSFSGMTFIFDTITSTTVSNSDTPLIVSTGSIADITGKSAKLSGVKVQPDMPGRILYGTGEFIYTGALSSGIFAFSGLLSDTQYFYRLAFELSDTGWILYSDTGSFRTLADPEFPPKPAFVFQSPTYLTSEDATLEEFTCDNVHSDCKINFDLSTSFSTGAPARLFSCELDFGLSLASGEESKCNPNVVTFPRWKDYTIRFRIINKADTTRISERTILVHAPLLGNDNSTGSTSSGSITIAIPEITIQSGLDASNHCREKDCSVNLLYAPKNPKEACIWTFGSGTYATGTELQCNPGYIHYGTGEFIIVLRVYEKNNPGNFRESTLIIFNNPSSVVSGGSGPPSNNAPPIVINEPEIVIQSGLNASRQCTKKDCALNLSYRVGSPKEACLWSFPYGAYASGTENRCNPGYVHYGIGEFRVTLRVYEQGNIFNFREKTLLFSNGTAEEISEGKEHPVNRAPVAFIKLQGSLGKTKTQEGKSVICHGVEECSINLSGEESYDTDRDKLVYSWNMWNGTTSDKENPVAVKYAVGTYRVTLRVTDPKGLWSEDNLIVIVEGKNTPEKTNVPIDPNAVSLRITGVSPNPLGADGVSEWAEISNTLSVDVSLAGCTLDDDPTKGSKPYHFGNDAILRANSKKRYYKLQTSINFNNTHDSANLFCGGRLISSISWNYSVPEGFIVSGQVGPYSERIRTRVTRVVDGDTIVAMVYGKAEKIRLIGVDTPETVDPRKSVQYFGKEASAFTKRMLEWQEIELEFDYNPRDKYNRLLAYAWIGGVNFNSELIRLGYGRAYLRFPFRYYKDFEKMGKESQKNKLGMWSNDEMVEVLKNGIQEDKKLLKQQLEKEDSETLDELIGVANDENIDIDGLDQELFDSLFRFDEEVNISSKTRMDRKNASVRKAIEGPKMDDIRIEIQGKLSKNRTMEGWIFICHTKTTCNVNLTAGKARKNTVYFWEFGNGKSFYGANPISQKYAIGKYQVHLRMLDSESGGLHDEYLSIAVKKLVTVKKVKTKKVKALLIKKEKPLVVREQLPFGQKSESAPTSESAVSVILLLIVFLSGGYAIVRKRLGKGV